MHANHTNRRLRAWRKLTGLISASVLALSVIGGGTATANNPSWSSGHGTDRLAPQPGSGASSSTVSAGKKVGFFEWLRNDGPSNIAQLYLTARAAVAGTEPLLTATGVGATWRIFEGPGLGPDNPVRNGTCPVATPIVCNIGALNASQTVYVTVAFTTPTIAVNNATLSATLDFNTTGATGSDGGDTSHGDDETVLDSVSLVPATNGDAAGDFNFNGLLGVTVAVPNQKVSGKNPQATTGSVVSKEVGAYVADGASADQTLQCDASLLPQGTVFNCSSLSSQWSEIQAGNGKELRNTANGPGIKVGILFSQLPKGLGGTSPRIYHYWTTQAVGGGTVKHAELVTAPCTLNSSGLPTNTSPCLIVSDKSVTVWLFHNGQMRG